MVLKYSYLFLRFDLVFDVFFYGVIVFVACFFGLSRFPDFSSTSSL